MNTIIEKIRAEIERRKKRYQKDESGYGDGAFCEDVAILSFLSDLEKECEKPTLAERLDEKEYEQIKQKVCLECPSHKDDYCGYVKRQLQRKCNYLSAVMYGYELGRQSKPKVSKGLEGEIDIYIADHYTVDNYDGVTHNGEYLDTYDVADIAHHFAKWQADKDLGKISRAYENGATFGMKLEKTKIAHQMMKEAVEGETLPLPNSLSILIPNITKNTYKVGQKVKLIIVKED